MSFADRVRIGAFARPHYAYCVYNAANLGKKLGYDAISIIEFGVAGGNGLVLLEEYAEEVGRELGIRVDVYGFDNATGLPAPVDYRDLPYHWKAGFFKMDEAALRQRLRRTTLVLGDVRDTSETFFHVHQPAPIGAVFHDLDFYSSTVPALRFFNADERYRLPRIQCYFDDILGGEVELYNDFTGVRLAVAEYNAENETKISPSYHLISRARPKPWYHQVYVVHDFQHSQYNAFIDSEDQQLPLT